MQREIKNLLVVAFMTLFALNGLIGIAGASDRKLRVAAVMPGTITDGSFNQSCYEGLKLIEKELGAEIAYTERVGQADQVENLVGYARGGYDLVIAHGGEMDDAAIKVAKKFPKTIFFVTNGKAQGENISNGGVNPTHYSHLLGVVGAKMTKTNKLAVVSGNEFPLVVSIYESFKNAVLANNPDADVSIIYTGSWDDVAKAKEAAFAQVAKGVDVLYPVLDLATLGIIEGAREKGVYVFGFSKDQLDVAPQNVLCSAIQNYSHVLLEIARLVKAGEFEGGKTYSLGLETPDVTGTGRINPNVPQPVIELVEQAKKDILAGKVTF